MTCREGMDSCVKTIVTGDDGFISRQCINFEWFKNELNLVQNECTEVTLTEGPGKGKKIKNCVCNNEDLCNGE
eukprot:01682.XXX_1925_2214_1 [CDS] Oithona nana genome sequencing.